MRISWKNKNIVIALIMCLQQSAQCQEIQKINEFSPAKYILPQSALKHGEAQVRQILHDRPNSANFISPGDPVWKWLVDQFAGEGIGAKIYWENLPPQNGAAAENHPLQYGVKPVIRVDNENGKWGVRGETFWQALCYELINIRKGAEFFQTCRKYLDAKPADIQLAKIYRKAFVEKMTMLEYRTLVSNRSFYYAVWLPSMKKKGIKSSESGWRLDIPLQYSNWITSEDAKAFIEYWGKSYDKCKPRR